MIRVRVISEWKDFENLHPEWDAFLNVSTADSLFLQWDYLQCWWETYGEKFTPRILVARDEQGALAGIAPLMIGRGHRTARRFLRHLSFIGQLCDSPPDYCDFILREGVEEEVMEAFFSHMMRDLSKEWDLLFHPLMPAKSVGLQLLRRRFEKSGASLRTVHPQRSLYIALPSCWDEYLASKSKNFRKKLRQPTQHLFERHRVDLWQAGIDLPLDDAMTVLRDLNRDRWGNQANSFRSRRFELFHRRLALRFHSSGRLSLRLLVVDEEAVAAQYDFIDPQAKRVYGFQSGWKQQWADRSVGRILQGQCLEAFIAQGLREYDFLAGESEYKLSWSNGSRMVCDVEVANPVSTSGRLFSLARTLRTNFTQVSEKAAAQAYGWSLATDTLMSL